MKTFVVFYVVWWVKCSHITTLKPNLSESLEHKRGELYFLLQQHFYDGKVLKIKKHCHL